MFTVGVHTQIISEDSVPRNQRVRGFVLLLFALSCLEYCLCISFEPQVTPAFFPTYLRSATTSFCYLPTCYSNHLQVFQSPSGVL